MSKIQKYAKRHYSSYSDFMNNFIATVLGIVLTFGSTMWYEHIQKKEAAEGLVERCLTNMEDRLKKLDGVIESYDKHDELFNQVKGHPIDSLSEELLGALIHEYTIQYDLIVNHAYEKSFSQSVTSHEILGQYAEVIGEGFEYLLYVEQMHEEVNRMQAELLKRQTLARNTYWDKGSIRLVVEETMSDPFFVYFQEWFSKHALMVRHMHYYLQFYIPQARRLWNGEISEEDFKTQTDLRWNEWQNMTKG